MSGYSNDYLKKETCFRPFKPKIKDGINLIRNKIKGCQEMFYHFLTTPLN